MTDQLNPYYAQYLIEQGRLREQEQAAAQFQRQCMQWEAAEVAKIREEIPEWHDDDEFRAGLQDLREWVIQHRGIAPEIANNAVPDAQTVVSYHRARQAQRRKEVDAGGSRRADGKELSDHDQFARVCHILGIEDE